MELKEKNKQEKNNHRFRRFKGITGNYSAN
jgi:hypothetical protein